MIVGSDSEAEASEHDSGIDSNGAPKDITVFGSIGDRVPNPLQRGKERRMRKRLNTPAQAVEIGTLEFSSGCLDDRAPK